MKKNIKNTKMFIPETKIKANQTIDIKGFIRYQVDKRVVIILNCE